MFRHLRSTCQRAPPSGIRLPRLSGGNERLAVSSQGSASQVVGRKAAISVRRATCLNGELLKRHGRCRSPFLYQFATRLLAACGSMNRAAFTALNGGVIEPPRKKHS